MGLGVGCRQPDFSSNTSLIFVEPQSGYSTGFNDTVRVETLGPEYLAGSVADVAQCELADLRAPGTNLVEHMNRFALHQPFGRSEHARPPSQE